MTGGCGISVKQQSVAGSEKKGMAVCERDATYVLGNNCIYRAGMA